LPRTLEIQIELPDATSEESAELAKATAKEAAISFLQQEGDLTIREAAVELGLTYEEYLKLLAERGLPATYDDTDPGTDEQLGCAWQSRRHSSR
jgi:predicted HTH domain antitoxin